MVRNEVGSTGQAPRNIGGKKQRLEAPVKTLILAKENFSFKSNDFKNIELWKKAILKKNIVPFPNAEGLELNNKEAQYKEGRYIDSKLTAAVSGTKYRFDISNTTYEAFLTYENSDFTRVFEITNMDEVFCDIQSDGSIKGRKISSFLIGNRNQATDSDVPFADVTIKYAKNTHSILKTDGEPSDLEGIYDLRLELIDNSTTSIKFQVFNISTGTKITQLEYDDFVVKDENQAVVGGLGSIPVTSNGVFEINGTNFKTGYTVEINGVIDLTEMSVEGANKLILNLN
ncbi:conserved protein of unknown function [Tenacibaculum sp. 190524A02b]|uniref:hypothetical protein n=1 Tax=Tenacibaculum vairaonense TaxID=3137860 RepID=UPI0032B27E9F